MKKSVLLSLFSACILLSCSNFSTMVTVKNEMDPLPIDAPVYVFWDDSDLLPDSAVYIGEIFSEYTFARAAMKGGGPTISDLSSSIARKARSYGANLIMVESVSDDYNKDAMKGKLYKINEFQTTKYNEESLKKLWKTRELDKLEGLYEIDLSDIDAKFYNKSLMVGFAIVKKDSLNYVMVYLSGFENVYTPWRLNWLDMVWNEGDIKAFIKKTDKSTMFSSTFFMHNKSVANNIMIKIDNGNLRIATNKGTEFYRRYYPKSSKYESLITTLTGFAIDKSKIITCYHGLAKGHSNIYVRGINGDFDQKYPAVLEFSDKENDISVIRLLDSNAKMEYCAFSTSESSKVAGEEVFVLGYPISTLMGEEIKLTTGIISSASGFGGNSNQYQITASIQPGNSGSPLFDKNGNLIGMVNSSITNTDNVGYSLKLKHFLDFFTKNKFNFTPLSENTYKDLSFSEKVEKFRKSIFIIEVTQQESDSDSGYDSN